MFTVPLSRFTSSALVFQLNEEAALSANAHVILRGARLKNTDNIYGIVLYTGPDTKLFRNSIKRVMKRCVWNHAPLAVV